MPFDKPQRVTPALIQRALHGEAGPARWLAQHIVACVDRQVRSVLRRNTTCRNRGFAEELVHDVAVYLYDNDAKLLRNWEEDRGASFDYYLGLITRNLVVRRLTQFKGNPAGFTPVEDMQQFLGTGTTEAQLDYVLELERVWAYVEEQLDERDRQRFVALYREGLSVDALAEREGISTNAIHAWTSRLRKRLRENLPGAIELLTEFAPG